MLCEHVPRLRHGILALVVRGRPSCRKSEQWHRYFIYRFDGRNAKCFREVGSANEWHRGQRRLFKGRTIRYREVSSFAEFYCLVLLRGVPAEGRNGSRTEMKPIMLRISVAHEGGGVQVNRRCFIECCEPSFSPLFAIT
jgi:hypothetical protein